ncbi:hypothetical protein K6V78_00040 [Streptococcus gallolyticus]|uniref:hypothetical protein n=1 Tax=Streptococcus hepaticus TaxID=3349163 RepID=UPI001C97D1FF|nr:hypothetical protein [Streptococcus gallolyticus]MBY5040355.1 hypothetical protein [Streptococcus gallolyticus]
MKIDKTFWMLLLFVAILLFLLGLNSGVYLYNVLAIIVSFIVYRYGYKELFQEYDEQQKAKRETAEKIYSALREGKKGEK